MTITYTWQVTGVKVRDDANLTDVIYQTHWKKIGTDADGIKGEFVGATPFDAAQVNPDNFVSFDQLTEEQILGWIRPTIWGQYAEHIDTQIQKAIDAQKKPGAAKTLPWGEPQAPVMPQ